MGFALLDDKGAPVAHNDAEITVTQNGVTVFHSASTHEYDGFFSLDVIFQQVGPYEVMAKSGELGTGMFVGTVVAPVNATVASIRFEPTALGGGMTQGTLSIVDAEGALLTHTDAIIDLRRANGALVSRWQAHIHSDPIVFTTAFPATGDYVFHVTAFRTFATGRSADFAAVIDTFPVTATVATPSGAPAVPTPSATPTSPRGPMATAGGLTLHGMYDPQPTVGLGQPIRLTAVVVDAMGVVMPHVDFSFALDSPAARAFASESLHEYDGLFEFVHASSVPGPHRAVLTASRGEETVSITYEYVVAPPVVALNPGRFTVSLTGAEDAQVGVPVNLTFYAGGATGPLPHSEVDVKVFREGEPAIYAFKLHTHASGESMATIQFPAEGEWIVTAEPILLMPQPSLIETARFTVSVAPGLMPDILTAADADVPVTNPVPALPVGLMVLAFVTVGLLRRR